MKLLNKKIILIVGFLIATIIVQAQKNYNSSIRNVFVSASVDIYQTILSDQFPAETFAEVFTPGGFSLSAGPTLSKKLCFEAGYNYSSMPALYVSGYSNTSEEYYNIQNSKIQGFQAIFKFYRHTEFSLYAPFGKYIGIGINIKNAEVIIPKTFIFETDYNGKRELIDIMDVEYYSVQAMGPVFSIGNVYPISSKIFIDLGFDFSLLLFGENYEFANNLAEKFVVSRNYSRAYYKLIFKI